MFDESSTGGTGAQDDTNQPGPRDTGDVLSDLFALLDDVSLSPIQRLRLTGELNKVRKELATATSLQKLSLARRMLQLRKELGAAIRPVSVDPQPQPLDASDEIAEGRGERNDTKRFYEFNEDRKPAQRKRENDAAERLLQQIEAGEVNADDLTDEQRQTLSKWSGQGGNMEDLAGTKGSAYEYFTPAPIAEGVWNLLTEMGFAGGRVLDPSCGTGVFGAMAPTNAAVEAIDLSPRSARVCQILNDGPGFRTMASSFEKVAAATPDESFDAVVTNIPFSDDVNARGAAALDDDKYQKETMEAYFLKRSMEKLRPGGLAAYLVPTRIVSGKDAKSESLRVALSMMAEFIGGYRLPSKVFNTTGTEVITDVIIFRKHSADAAEKIGELKEQNPALLTEALVMWPEFIGGTYFQGEGLRHVIGTMGKAKGQWGEVDVLNSDLTMSEIGKLMRKLGGSRIDWAKLDTAPTQPITYRDGDTMIHAGQTLQMRDGRWVSLGSAVGDQEAQRELAAQGASLASALQAVVADVKLPDALAYVEAMKRVGRIMEVPGWLSKFAQELVSCERSDLPMAWELGITGLAVDSVEAMHSEPGFNFLEAYPKLSAEMMRLVGSAKNPPKGLSKLTRECVRKITTRYDRATRAYSEYWLGTVADAGADQRSADEKFDAIKYQAESADGFVSVEAVKAAAPDFDPHTSDDWCISADGTKAARAGDYFVGGLGDFLRKIDGEIAAAPSEEVRAKLQRQKNMARGRCRAINYRNVQFNLTTPFLSDDEKLKFLKGFLDPRFEREFDEYSGQTKFKFTGGGDRSEREKLMARVAWYMNGGSISLSTAEFADKKAAMVELRRIINAADTQLDAWAKANPQIIGRLEAEANDPDRLYFEAEDDESPLNIAGLHPDLKPHGYQNGYVRRMGREFSGINAFDVGLGKTLSALMAGQHALAIGSKKKVCWVVPASVLVNWRKEAIIGKGKPGDADYRAPAYSPEQVERCLFVGMTERGGKVKTDSSLYDVDLAKLRTNRHNKVFMSYEAFQRMRLRQETAEAYEAYLRSVDDTFAESMRNAENDKKSARVARLSKMLVEDSAKSAGAPFFEDCGFDAVFFDEGHKLKNARVPVATKSAKYLSLPQPATVGMDASAKCWFVRRGNKRGDGVGLLTATPLTNSPAEFFSMLSLAVGDSRLNNMVGAKGPDAFMSAVVETEPDDTLTLDGEEKNQDFARKFTGLRNVDILRSALGQSVIVKTAADVGLVIKMPKQESEVTTVNLTTQSTELLDMLKSAWRFAIDSENGVSPARGSAADLAKVEAMFGEPPALIANTFNLINKMEQVALDPDMADRVAYFHFNDAQAEAVAALVAEWNKKPPNFTTEFPNSRVTPEMIVKRKRWETETGVEHVELTVQARAIIEGNTVVLVGNSHSISLDFDAMAEKRGIDFDFNVPPKIAALLANFQNEEANPRGMVNGLPGRRVRQIIFCDHLEVHAKVRRLLIKRCGVKSSAIAIIAGKVNGKPEDVQAVQDGFNDDSDSNKFRVILANERAEMGVNLQVGTQATHHLSYRGSTPDGLQQRNGRAARQGNNTGYVRVYRYDADGTFDAYKRAIIDSKASWITDVLAKEGGNSVAISGQLSDSEYAVLIDASDPGAGGMAGVIERKRQADLLARAESAQQRQIVSAETIKSQRKWLKDNATAMRTVRVAVAELAFAIQRAGAIERRMASPSLNPDAVAGLEKQLAVQRTTVDAMAANIEASVDLKGNSAKQMAQEALNGVREKKRMATMEDLSAKTLWSNNGWSPGSLRDSHFGALVEGSPLVNAWAGEKKVAEELIEESGRIILREANANVGGYSERAHKIVMEGDFSVTGGKLWMRGTVYEWGGILGVVVNGDTTIGIDAETGEPTYRAPTVPSLAGSKNVKVFNHEQDGWTALVRRMAKAEDTYAESGAVVTPTSLPSHYIAEVAQLRTVATMTSWAPGAWLLPSPKFPVAIRPETGAEGTLRGVLAAEQGLKWSQSSWDREFIAASDSAFTPVDGETISATVTAALIDEAKRRGLKVTNADAAAAIFFKTTLALKPGDKPTLADALAGAATGQEVDERAVAWVKSIVDEAVDVDSFMARGPEEMISKFSSSIDVYYATKRAVQEALRAAESARLNEQRAKEAAERAAQEAESGVVWGWIVVGDTYRFKNAVQGGVRAAIGSASPPYPVAWKGKDGTFRGTDGAVAANAPNAPPNSWITTRAGFDFMLAKYPTDARSMSFQPANP